MALARFQYLTSGGQEVLAVTAAQMREIDRIAVEETGPNLFQMMENAGRNLARQAIEIVGRHWRERQILVLAGSGGNGGGGICAARHLANRGASVTLVLAGSLPDGGVPAFQYRVYTGTLGREVYSDAVSKTGLRPDNAGHLVLADIGIPAETFRRAGVTMVNPFGDQFRIPLTAS